MKLKRLFDLCGLAAVLFIVACAGNPGDDPGVTLNSSVSAVTSTTATASGTVTFANFLPAIQSSGVVYAPTTTNSAPDLNSPNAFVNTQVSATDGAGSFKVDLSGLSPGTNYSYQVFLTFEGSSPIYSGPGNFTTSAVPTVTTPTSANITATAATLGGTATAAGGSAITQTGVVYSLTSANGDPIVGGTGVTMAASSSTGTGVFTVDVSDLTPASAYTFKAFVTSSAGTAYTDPATFTTNAAVVGDLDLAYNPSFSGPDGTVVYATAVQPDGNVLVGGSFAKAGGAVHANLIRLRPDGTLDPAFNPGTGPNATVSCVAVQADGQILIGGTFTSVNGTPSAHLARLNADGSLESTATFNPGTGPNGSVLCFALQPNGQILIGGQFSAVNGVAVGDIARLNPDGSLESTATFNPGLGAQLNGASTFSVIHTIALQTTGKIVVGGSFDQMGSAAHANLARLNTNGSVDSAFTASIDAGGSVLSLAVQLDSGIIVGGAFGNLNGIARNNLGRLLSTGAIDNAFNPGTGADNAVDSLTLQTDRKIIVGGFFTHLNGTATGGIGRLTSTGAYDTIFDVGAAGGDSVVYSVAVQADGEILLGGDFDQINDTPRTLFARFTNYAAQSTLTVTSPTQIQWLRRGSSPQVAAFAPVTFEVSTNGGSSWTLLGTALHLNTSDWNLTGLSLPAQGTLRARGRTTGGDGSGSAGLVQQIAPFVDPIAAPTLDNQTFTNVTATSATLGGSIASIGGAPITSSGVIYSETSINSSPSIGGAGVTQVPGTASGVGPFTVNVTDLQPNTGYSFAAYAANSAGNNTTFASDFTTPSGAPQVDIPTATLLSATSATLGGTVESDGGSPITERGIVFTAMSNVTLLFDPSTATKLVAGGTTGPFTVNANGLSSSTRYVFMAYATNALGTGYSVPSIFGNLTLPSVTAPTTSGVSLNGATLGGTESNAGNPMSTARGIVYAPTATNNNPQILGTGVTVVPDQAVVATVGTFAEPITDLSPGTSYSFAAYVTNSQGTVYTTPASTFVTSSNLPTVAAPTVASITSSKVTLGGNVTNIGSTPVTVRGVVYAPTATNSNPQLGGAGVQVAMDGAGGPGVFSESITGLTAAVGYSFTAYASNSFGTGYSTPVAFTSASSTNLPVVVNATSSSISGFGATLGANVTSAGQFALTARGVVYAPSSINSNPQIGGSGVIMVKDSAATTGAFSENIAGLLPGTAYTFAGFATSSAGTAYSTPASTFQTLAGPTVTNPTSAQITSSSALLGGTATAQGDGAITSRGVVYALAAVNPHPKIGGVGVTAVTDGAGGTGAFTESIMGLAPATAYSFAAFATNSVATIYTSPVSTFSTAASATGTLDVDFTPDVSGAANNVLVATAVQPDGKVVIGGSFNTAAGASHPSLARLNADGSIDSTFNASTDGIVYSLAVQPDGKILVAGAFRKIDTQQSPGIGRLNADGTLDESFLPGSGANDTVFSVGLQPDGRVLLAGFFTTMNGASAGRIARLNADGSADANFSPGTGADNAIYSVALQTDGSILVGGKFQNFNGTALGGIARLSASGAVDPNFTPQTGVNGSVESIAVQSDGKILLAGEFTSVDGTASNRIARLASTGAVDATFQPGTGADGTITSLALQADGKIVLGGQFQTINGTASNRFARLTPSGSLDTSFSGGTLPNTAVEGVALQADGQILVGGRFSVLNGTGINLIQRLNNGAASQGVNAVDPTQVQWLRAGTAPEFTAVAFELSTDGGATWSPLGAGARLAGGWQLTGLSLPTTGSLRATGHTAGGYLNGSSGLVQQIATFNVALPGLTAPTAVNVSPSVVTLGGTVSSTGGSTITGRGIVFAITARNSDPLIGGPGVGNLDTTGTTGTFSLNASGLSAGTSYSYKVYATNASGTGYISPAATFITLPAAPMVSAPTSSSVTAHEALLGGTVTSQGASSINVRGVVYAVSTDNNNPQIGGTLVHVVNDSSAAVGAFAESIANLSPGTTYSYVAFASNSTSTTYTTPVSTFTTEVVTAPTVNTPTDTNVAGTTATLGGTVTDAGSSPLTARGVIYSVTSVNSNPQLTGASVTVVSDAVSTLGTFTENITRLAPVTGYSFVAFATSDAGTTYTSPVSTFTTPPDAAPTQLVYENTAPVYSAGLAIAPNVPSNSGGAIVTYTSDPLPAGLSLDPATGIISGVPTAAAAANAYTITGTNTGGHTTASITITVQQVLVAVNDTVLVHQAGVRVVIDVLANDLDVDKSSLKIIALSKAKFGSVAFSPTRKTLIYIPSPALVDSARIDTFTYTIKNSQGQTAQATVSVLNSFFPIRGVYDGLLTIQTGGPVGQPNGYLRLALTASGSFTGRVSLAGRAYPFHGVLKAGTAGTAVTIPRPSQASIVLNLSLDGTGATGVAASTLTDGIGYLGTTGARTTFTAANPTAEHGKYTVQMPPPPGGSSTLPAGTGWAAMNVAATGTVTFVGKTGDGAAYSTGSLIHQGDSGSSLAFYTSLYGLVSSPHLPGILAGEITFEDSSGSDCDGSLTWIKPAQTKIVPYQAGFATTVDFQGAHYVVEDQEFNLNTPGPITAALELTSGDLSAEIDHLTHIVKRLSATGTNPVMVADPGSDALHLTLNPGNGTFTGTFRAKPLPHLPTVFGGTVNQKSAFGAGEFLGTTHSGNVILNPR